ncbi:MAG: thioredoxin family protein [Bacteroidia bacterium]
MNIGDSLKPFCLKSTENQMVNSFDFADKYAMVLVVTCNHCPYALAYWPRLVRLFKKFEEDNLAMVAINGNDVVQKPADSFSEMQRLAQQYRLPFPYLYDENQAVLKSLGAQKTPEVFVFNSRRELVYKGAIDDNWENESGVMSVHLEDAIEYTLDGLEIDYPEIPAVGCSVKWKE